MHIISDFEKDRRTRKSQPGSYEWWYYDGISSDGTYSFAVIFYEGNPFSSMYSKALEKGQSEFGRGCTEPKAAAGREPEQSIKRRANNDRESKKGLKEMTAKGQKQNNYDCRKAGSYPAISISIYRKGEPVYYGFREHRPDECRFDSGRIFGKVGGNTFSGATSGDLLHYRLELNQELPSGDSVRGELEFISPEVDLLFGKPAGRSGADRSQTDDITTEAGEEHTWNLVQPRATVKGRIKIEGYNNHYIHMEGTGYHDHNMGSHPLGHRFEKWYWGRFHLEDSTLIYYLMDTGSGHNYNAWLIRNSGESIMLDKQIRLEDKGISIFGLQSARRIQIDGEIFKCLIQQERLLDNGPFYQRFLSKVVLESKSGLSTSAGITEYLQPGRINSRMFRPLVNMRIVYPGKSHWVQRSPKLYRWTW